MQILCLRWWRFTHLSEKNSRTTFPIINWCSFELLRAVLDRQQDIELLTPGVHIMAKVTYSIQDATEHSECYIFDLKFTCYVFIEGQLQSHTHFIDVKGFVLEMLPFFSFKPRHVFVYMSTCLLIWYNVTAGLVQIILDLTDWQIFNIKY